MKKINLYLFLSLIISFWLLACPGPPDKPDPGSNPIGEPDSRDASQSIKVKVSSSALTFKALQGVRVEVMENGSPKYIGDTNASGEVALQNFEAADTFVFSKANYISNRFVFSNVGKVNDIGLYLKLNAASESDKMYAVGTVYNKNNDGLSGIKVQDSRTGDSVMTDDTGKYSIELKNGAPTSLSFTGKTNSVAVGLIVIQDTTEIVVYLDDIIGLGSLKE